MTGITAPMMRPADVARELGVSRVRIYALMRTGEIPSVRIGGAIRVPRLAWETWLRRRAADALAAVSRPDCEPESPERPRHREAELPAKPEPAQDNNLSEVFHSTGNPDDDAVIHSQIEERYATARALGTAIADLVRRREGGR